MAQNRHRPARPGTREHSCGTPHPDPRNFTPTLDTLIDPDMHGEGLNMALFSVRPGPGAGDSPAADSESDVGSIAVDPAGRVLLVSPSDTKGILYLAQEALTTPTEDDGGWGIIILPAEPLPVHPLHPVRSLQLHG
ncbi:hypothetical protein LshimejAT787_2300750 [Lyophyllum shimeji]|uniref:Uncharacterized protein n=1 Tax=Lyophyllum shimeji TaxID=47721 RepID=A0A9P3Q0R7_LYOSH|nr:hypothetical protein LshimejAT787_2300750 [Lyophyllum shimeji]